MAAQIHISFDIEVTVTIEDTSTDAIEKAISDAHKKVNTSVGSMQYLYNNDKYKMLDANIKEASVFNENGAIFGRVY